MSSLNTKVRMPEHYPGGALDGGGHPESAPLPLQPQAPRTDQLLLRMNHEVRTAVNAILGATELLLESRMTRQQSYHVNILRMSAEHLLTGSSEILDVARAELGSLQLRLTSF